MKDTLNQDAQETPTEGKKSLPSSRAISQVEPQPKDVVETGRLMQSVSIGRKPEVYEVEPGEVESLRPSAEEMKNG